MRIPARIGNIKISAKVNLNLSLLSVVVEGMALAAVVGAIVDKAVMLLEPMVEIMKEKEVIARQYRVAIGRLI